MSDLLFLSNGHGEDMIAGRILDELRAQAPELAVEAWPMVGRGEAYRARGVPAGGASNLLPSAGFATTEWRLMGADLRAGWIGTHWAQFLDARRRRGRYRLLVAVGDIVPLLASVVARAPFMFVGCAKSDYYGPRFGYTALEKRLMRRHALAVFPRDGRTARNLAAAGIAARDLGNPMMDGLEGTGDRLGIPPQATVVCMLPGTRDDAGTNMLDLLAAADAMARRDGGGGTLRFVFPVRDAFDPAAMASEIACDPRLAGMEAEAMAPAAEGVVLRIGLAGGAQALAVERRFADALRLSSLVVGMAGTANEQAVGLGIPLVAVPSRGVQGEHYVRMKMRYFGESAVAVAREPEAIAAEALAILADPARAARMGAAGRERMGSPGASRAIAAEIVAAARGLAARERAA